MIEYAMAICGSAVVILCIWGYKMGNSSARDESKKDGSLLAIASFAYGVTKSTALSMIFVLIVLFSVVFGILGYLLLVAELETPPTFKQSLFKEVDNPVNRTQAFELTMNLESQTFGAQSSITTYVKLEPISDERQFYNASAYPIPQTYRIWFEGTYCSQSFDPYSRLFPCFIELQRQPEVGYNWWNAHWQGNTVSNYTTGGIFDISLGNETTIVQRRVVTGEPFVRIESVEATNSFRAAQESNALQLRTLGVSLMAFAISILSIGVTVLTIFVMIRQNSSKKCTKQNQPSDYDEKKG